MVFKLFKLNATSSTLILYKPVAQIWRNEIKPLVHPKIKREEVTSSLIRLIDGYIDNYNYYLSQLQKS